MSCDQQKRPAPALGRLPSISLAPRLLNAWDKVHWWPRRFHEVHDSKHELAGKSSQEAGYTRKPISTTAHHLRKQTMCDVHRRDFLAGTAGLAAAAVLLGSKTAEAGDPSFMNNVPDPLLSSKEL